MPAIEASRVRLAEQLSNDVESLLKLVWRKKKNVLDAPDTGDRDSEHVVAVRASSTADAGRRMAVFTRSLGRPKRLRGHFHRILKSTTVPVPERLRDMEFDLNRGDSSGEEGSDSEPEAWWGGSQPFGEDDYDPGIAVSSHAEVVETDFGHRYPTDFGQTDFGQTDFGQS